MEIPKSTLDAMRRKPNKKVLWSLFIVTSAVVLAAAVMNWLVVLRVSDPRCSKPQTKAIKSFFESIGLERILDRKYDFYCQACGMG